MLSKEKIYDSLKTVVDPEVGFDIVALGLIYDVKIDGKDVKVDMTLSTKGCPLHELLKQWAYDAVMRVEDVEKADINIVWEPAWNITMANDEVKHALG